ncbi:DM13 domain-containing protein [Streptomyces sp. SMC 277]|uniref:DM13 domain-containing protein n=1 Tax=Streptomyces antimicrobicus TaxID=2883108 RepID=A0ABS8BFI5_9ACTN|nr:DM13 domain-containing protein [Streptomyces antimicrobicus]MCB5183286.1 DM13 domain-containing protein [Streptomyces antimicrobicus]
MVGVALAVAAAVVAAGLLLFEPWKLWTDETVSEALPTGAPAAPAAPGTSGGSGTSGAPSAAAAQPPQTVARGTFISHEHETKGTAKVVRLADGSHTLRLEGLDTSNGPDLRVWLTDAPVKPGTEGWKVFDDGKHISLGKLKGNKGDQNYEIPAGLDLATYTSVTIWCDRFSVSFGAAELAKA